MKLLFTLLLLCSSASAQTMYAVPPAHPHTEAVTSDPQNICFQNMSNITYNTTNGRLFACIGPPIAPAIAPFGSWMLIGQLRSSIVRKTAAYTLTTSDSTVLCDASGAALTLTLPPNPQVGQIVDLKKIDATGNACTVSGNGKTIDRATSLIISAPMESHQLKYDGAEWWML